MGDRLSASRIPKHRSHPTLLADLAHWVDDVAALTCPDSVHWCDGSAEEYDRLCQLLVDGGTFTKLDDAKQNMSKAKNQLQKPDAQAARSPQAEAVADLLYRSHKRALGL